MDLYGCYTAKVHGTKIYDIDDLQKRLMQTCFDNLSALLLDDALKPATPLIAPLISGVAGLSTSSSSKEDTLNI